MNILIVGNGFDLAHGLKTRYTDFLDFVCAFQQFREKKNLNSSTTQCRSFHFDKLKIEYPDLFSNIFYHNDEALGKYISNLVKIIGEDKLIRMTDGYEHRINFQPQLNNIHP